MTMKLTDLKKLESISILDDQGPYTNAVHEDLCKRIREKLQQWMKDSVALYEMGGLDLELSLQDTLALMIEQSSYLAAGSTMDAEGFAHMNKLAFMAYREYLESKDAAEKSATQASDAGPNIQDPKTGQS